MVTESRRYLEQNDFRLSEIRTSPDPLQKFLKKYFWYYLLTTDAIRFLLKNNSLQIVPQYKIIKCCSLLR